MRISDWSSDVCSSDLVAIAAAAFASAEGDARNGAERVAQREQVLLADRLGGNDGDRLRRVEDRGGGLRRLDAVDLRAFLDRRVGDDDALQPRGVALIGGGRILGGGGKRYGRRNEADAAEREERSRSAVRLTIGLGHEHPFWSQNQSCRMLMRAIRMKVKNDSQLQGGIRHFREAPVPG